MIPANGGSANVTYTITPNGASQLQNTVVVGARMSDSNTANNTDSVTTTVNSISFAAGPDRDDHGDHNGHDNGSSSGSTSVFMLVAGLLVLVSRRRRTRHIFLPAHL